MIDILKKTLEENLQYYRLQEKQALASLTGLPRGTIKEKVTGKRTYYYLQYRHQGQVMQQYLGRTFPEELSREIEKRKAIRAQLREIRDALKLLRSKQSDDLLGPVQQIIRRLAREGLWEAGAEVVGSWCFYIYQTFLGVSAYPIRTDDLDILVPIPWKGPTLDLAELLREMGFSESFKPNGSTTYHRPGIRVEFLTAARGRGAEESKTEKKLGISPQALRFMDMLLQQPLQIKIMAGVTVTVPAPSTFLLHKLLISGRRTSEHKHDKDLAQAIAVARFVLQDELQREALAVTWATLLKSWRSRVLKAVARAAETYPMEQGTLDGLGAFLRESSRVESSPGITVANNPRR